MSSPSEFEREPALRPRPEELVGEGVGVYRKGFRCTRLLPREEVGEVAPLLFLDRYTLSPDVSEPLEMGGDKGVSYTLGEGGGEAFV